MTLRTVILLGLFIGTYGTTAAMHKPGQELEGTHDNPANTCLEIFSEPERVTPPPSAQELEAALLKSISQTKAAQEKKAGD